MRKTIATVAAGLLIATGLAACSSDKGEVIEEEPVEVVEEVTDGDETDVEVDEGELEVEEEED